MTVKRATPGEFPFSAKNARSALDKPQFGLYNKEKDTAVFDGWFLGGR